jgi:MFS family permease
VVVVSAGVRAAPSVLLVPLEQEFHWSRATISFSIGINLILYGTIGPFAAAVMDRFGARRTMIIALAATAAGVALTSAMLSKNSKNQTAIGLRQEAVRQRWHHFGIVAPFHFTASDSLRGPCIGSGERGQKNLWGHLSRSGTTARH